MATKIGTSRNDILNGTTFNDILKGRGGNDILRGFAGNDKLFGDAGNDVLNGGAGRDLLTGGAGRDTFVFKHGRETGLGSKADVITDFTSKDFIHLRHIDADKTVAGNQDFKFLGNAAFTGHAGELNYQFVGSGKSAKTIISGDQNGDGQADFQIVLLKHIDVAKACIIGVL